MYHYIRTEPDLYTVGTGTPRSLGGTDWEPESDHATAAEAARRVAQLNGGGDPSCNCAMEIAELRRQVEELAELIRQTRALVSA
jgi:hypothetical protein